MRRRLATISSVSVNPDHVRDGAPSQGTVTLAFPDPSPTTALLFSGSPTVATVPASVVIPAGATSATFPIATNAAAPAEIVQIMAAIQNVPRTANLSVNAATPAGATLASVRTVPTTLTGGSSATGTVTFTGTTDGADVDLSSSNPAVLRVPSDVVVNGGARSGAFAVSTSTVSAPTTVTITARWFGITRTTTVTVTPGAPAQADRVAIKKARWKAGLLTIEATSTNPNAILSVFSQSGGSASRRVRGPRNRSPATYDPGIAVSDPTELDVRGVVKRAVFFVVVIGACIVLLMKLPGVEDVRERFNSAEPMWIAVTAAFSLTSMFGFVRALWAAFDRLMPWRRALILGFAEQGANVLLPAGGAGGPALGALVMKRAGVPGDLAAQRHAVLFLATSSVSFVALAVAGIGVTINLLRGDAPLVGSLLPAVFAIIVMALCFVAARARVPREPEVTKFTHTIWRAWTFVHEGLRTTLLVLRHGDRLLIAGAVTYYAFDVAALGAAFQAFGGGAPPVGEFVLAYTIGHAGALLPTPGGVGGTEGGLIGMMVVYGAPVDVATAAVLAYRVFQLGLPAILGALSMLRIRALLADESRRERVAAAFEEAREAGRW